MSVAGAGRKTVWCGLFTPLSRSRHLSFLTRFSDADLKLTERHKGRIQ